MIHEYLLFRYTNQHIPAEQTVWNQFKAIGKFTSYDQVREALLLYPHRGDDISPNTYIYIE